MKQPQFFEMLIVIVTTLQVLNLNLQHGNEHYESLKLYGKKIYTRIILEIEPILEVRYRNNAFEQKQILGIFICNLNAAFESKIDVDCACFAKTTGGRFFSSRTFCCQTDRNSFVCRSLIRLNRITASDYISFEDGDYNRADSVCSFSTELFRLKRYPMIGEKIVC